MNVPVKQLGSIGFVPDIESAELPMQAWTRAHNVRCLGPVVEKAMGEFQLVTVLSLGDPVSILDIFSVVSDDQHLWVLCAADAVRSFDSAATDLIDGSSAPYGATAQDRWTGGMLNGVLVLNNPIDKPQMWDLPGAATDLADLTAWDSAWRARVMRPFKNFLVALAVTKSSVYDKRMVKWSHSAAPLTVPASWDEADPTVDAGEVSLAEGQDALVDCLPLSDVNMVYAERQSWVMRLSGTNDIFAFSKVFEFGLLTVGCAVSFTRDSEGPEEHFVVTHDDFKVHNGQSVQSIGTDRVRKWFFDQITATNRPFVRAARRGKEIWVLFSASGGTLNDTALIWNHQYGSWYTRDMRPHRAVGTAFQAPSVAVTPWSSLVGAWSAQTWTWGNDPYVQVVDQLVYYDETDGQLLNVAEDYADFDGTAIAMVLEHESAPLKGQAQGQPIFDEDVRAIVRRMWPRLAGDAGVTLSVSLGYQETRDAVITWIGPRSFVLGSTRPCDFIFPYRYLSVRIEETSALRLRLAAYDLEIAATGKF